MYKHLLNLDEQRLICMGGLQGAGKSTIVDEFEKAGYVVICPDRIRFEFARAIKGNENKFESQLDDVLYAKENIVWMTAERRLKKAIEQGKSVIFDATSLNRKARKGFIKWAEDCNVKPIAIYVECPLEIAKERNAKRGSTVVGHDENNQPIYGRYVPEFVIELKWRTQTLPTIQEGFKECIIIHVGLQKKQMDAHIAMHKLIGLKSSENLEQRMEELHNDGVLKTMFPLFERCWGMDQQNKNHSLPLHMHMIKAAETLQNESLELFTAGLLHDIGKFETKQKFGKMLLDTNIFKTKDKVEIVSEKENGFVVISQLTPKVRFSQLVINKYLDIDENYHYYEHDIVGAILARREIVSLGLTEEFASKVYEYIFNHMAIPFQSTSEKAMRKIIEKLGKETTLEMLKMRKADKGAGSKKDYVDTVHQEHVDLVDKILKEENHESI